RFGEYRAPNHEAIYRHADAGWRPSPGAFNFFGAGATEFSAAGTELVLVSAEPVGASLVYPFAHHPELAIPNSLPGGKCNDAQPLETLLRGYAAHEMPAAADPDIFVEASAAYVDSVPSRRRGSCTVQDDVEIPLPACTKPRSRETRTETCRDPV